MRIYEIFTGVMSALSDLPSGVGRRACMCVCVCLRVCIENSVYSLPGITVNDVLTRCSKCFALW